jgi:indole-3-glycerol phosphate synthase
LSSLSAKTGSVLDRIVAVRREALARAKQVTPAAKLEERAGAAPPVRDFAAALSRDSLNVIAELKKASPSRGLLRRDYNPAALAPALEAAGAAALSDLADLQAARSLCRVSVLRKDFLFDSYQVLEARAAGADAYLLIAALFSAAELRQLLLAGRQLGMAALVEVHTAEELTRALEAGAELVGVNNRNLKTLEVEVETSLRLVEQIPDHCLAVSESGLRTGEQLQRLRAAGFDAFLIGESLMQAPDPAQALRALLGG